MPSLLNPVWKLGFDNIYHDIATEMILNHGLVMELSNYLSSAGVQSKESIISSILPCLTWLVLVLALSLPW